MASERGGNRQSNHIDVPPADKAWSAMLINAREKKLRSPPSWLAGRSAASRQPSWLTWSTKAFPRNDCASRCASAGKLGVAPGAAGSATRRYSSLTPPTEGTTCGTQRQAGAVGLPVQAGVEEGGQAVGKWRGHSGL